MKTLEMLLRGLLFCYIIQFMKICGMTAILIILKSRKEVRYDFLEESG